MPQTLRNVMISEFKSNFDYYERVIRSKLAMNGQPVIDPFEDSDRPKHFQYKQLLNELLDLKIKFGIVGNTSGSVATPAGTVSNDPLVEPYNKIVSKFVGEPTTDSNTAKNNNQSTDDCNKFVIGINELLDSDEELEEYEEDSD